MSNFESENGRSSGCIMCPATTSLYYVLHAIKLYTLILKVSYATHCNAFTAPHESAYNNSCDHLLP